MRHVFSNVRHNQQIINRLFGCLKTNREETLRLQESVDLGKHAFPQSHIAFSAGSSFVTTKTAHSLCGIDVLDDKNLAENCSFRQSFGLPKRSKQKKIPRLKLE